MNLYKKDKMLRMKYINSIGDILYVAVAVRDEYTTVKDLLFRERCSIIEYIVVLNIDVWIR